MVLALPSHAEGPKDGTYTKTVNAMQGALTLELVMKDGKIADLKALHVETPGLAPMPPRWCQSALRKAAAFRDRGQRRHHHQPDHWARRKNC